MNIGERLRNLRERNNLTQEEVGNRIGVTKATVNRYETGGIDIKRTIAIKLSEVFKVSPAYIMGWADDERITNEECNPTNEQNSLTYKYNSLNPKGQQMVDEYIRLVLSSNEQNSLTYKYNSLNSKGQQMVDEYIRLVLSNSEYKKIEAVPSESNFVIAAHGGKENEQRNAPIKEITT